MSAETYSAAAKRLLRELAAAGWRTEPTLKVPHATTPDGRARIWFRPQAVYMVKGNAQALANARSLFVDFRGMSAGQLARIVAERE